VTHFTVAIFRRFLLAALSVNELAAEAQRRRGKAGCKNMNKINYLLINGFPVFPAVRYRISPWLRASVVE
jgi:hypothetical protein